MRFFAHYGSDHLSSLTADSSSSAPKPLRRIETGRKAESRWKSMAEIQPAAIAGKSGRICSDCRFRRMKPAPKAQGRKKRRFTDRACASSIPQNPVSQRSSRLPPPMPSPDKIPRRKPIRPFSIYFGYRPIEEMRRTDDGAKALVFYRLSDLHTIHRRHLQADRVRRYPMGTVNLRPAMPRYRLVP